MRQTSNHPLSATSIAPWSWPPKSWSSHHCSRSDLPGTLTEVTEIVTGLGTLFDNLETATATKPQELVNVPDVVWARLVEARQSPRHAASVATAFANGAA